MANSNNSTSSSDFLSPPVVIEENSFYPDSKQPTESFLYPAEYEGHLEGVVISRDDIQKRTIEIAKQISLDYKGRRPYLICVLKGSCMIFHTLLEALQNLKQIYTIHYIRVKSYEGTSSTGTVSISGIDLRSLQDQPVILVEDIIDTGQTLSKLISKIENEGNPESLEVCSLLIKRVSSSELNHKMVARTKYSGFSIPDLFIVGYGLDCNEWYRDLKDIWLISEVGKKFAL